MGKAFTYARNSWSALGRFLEDAAVPLDNNASEAALRRVALGRKNYLFVGDVDTGDHIGVLYTLIATCEARGINPFVYVTDALERIGDVANAESNGGAIERLVIVGQRHHIGALEAYPALGATLPRGQGPRLGEHGLAEIARHHIHFAFAYSGEMKRQRAGARRAVENAHSRLELRRAYRARRRVGP
jgi:hypothetical protein